VLERITLVNNIKSLKDPMNSLSHRYPYKKVLLQPAPWEQEKSQEDNYGEKPEGRAVFVAILLLSNTCMCRVFGDFGSSSLD
jgi:hypothetical protein